MQKVLTIAGSDCSGGAGIQADLKTMAAFKMYGMSVITSLTAQNTTGVYGIFDSSPEFVANQIDCIFQDIIPDAVKIGMVSKGDLIIRIADRLGHYQAQNIVLDPVMVSTSGSKLLEEHAVETLSQYLLPLASLLTPNIPEAEILSERKIDTEQDMELAAKTISSRYHSSVLVKGGHQLNDANDVLYYDGKLVWFYGERIHNPNTHGTGCTLSSAIACGLAAGYPIEQSVKNAKQYLSNALRAQLNLGKGSGPINHCVSV